MVQDQRTIKVSGHTYQLLKLLGSGLTGEVYLAKEEGRDEPVAFKLLNQKAYTAGQLDLFKREFSTLCTLHHPHLCKVYDFGYVEDEKRHFFTSEFIEGSDLYTFTDKIPAKDLEEIFVQIVDGLAAIHAAGLLHLDIKGANILVTTINGKPFAKIVDFGLATPAIETPKFVAGTVRYISPEMITKSRSIDYRADLYSLGIVLFRMLAKRYPNQGSSMEDVLKWHVRHRLIEEEPLIRMGTPKYLIDTVTKLTDPVPTNRFSSANVIIKYIELHSGKNYKSTQREELAALTQEGPLVGRDELMRKITQLIKDIKKQSDQQTPQTLVFSGAHGMGKSRLLKETKYLAELEELNIMEITPELENRGIDVITEAIAKLPFCLFVDDFHRLSMQSQRSIIGLIEHIFTQRLKRASMPVLIFIGYTTSLEDEQVALPLELGMEDVRLKTLNAEDISQYIKQFLGDENPPEKLVDEILNYSGGIPELIHIVASGLGSSQIQNLEDIDHLFSDKIRLLSDQAKNTLCLIALAEKALPQRDIEKMMSSDNLPDLKRTGFIRYDVVSDSFTAATGAISRSIEKMMPKEVISNAAKVLYTHIDKTSPDDIDSLARLGQLFLKDDELTKLLQQTARKKDLSGNVNDALKYYRIVLDKLPSEDKQKPEILRKLVNVSILSGNLNEAKAYIEEIKKCDLLNTADYVSLAWIFRLSGDPKMAMERIDEAIALVDAKKQEPELLRLLNEKAQCYVQLGNVDEASQIFTDTRQKAAALKKEEQLKVPNNNLGIILAMQGKIDEAVAFYKEKYALFSTDKRLACSILTHLAYIYQQSDKLDDAIYTYKESYEITKSTGDTHNAIVVLANLICLCQSKALYSDALDYAMDSLKVGAQGFSRKQLGQALLTIGGLHIYLGLEDVAMRYLNDAEKIFTESNDALMRLWTKLSLAFLYRNINDYNKAIECLLNVISEAQNLKQPQLHELACHDMADLHIEMCDFKNAREDVNKLTRVWPGKTAREMDIRVEIIKNKLNVLAGVANNDTLERLLEINELCTNKGLKEPASESYQLISKIYEQQGDHERSREMILKAKAIVDDIEKALSEEYRDSYKHHKFRKSISDESVRFDKVPDSILQTLTEEALPEKKSAGKEAPSDKTSDLSEKDSTRNLK